MFVTARRSPCHRCGGNAFFRRVPRRVNVFVMIGFLIMVAFAFATHPKSPDLPPLEQCPQPCSLTAQQEFDKQHQQASDNWFAEHNNAVDKWSAEMAIAAVVWFGASTILFFSTRGYYCIYCRQRA